MAYDGFSIACGCICKRCGNRVTLEGYADADGQHFCPYCHDYVTTQSMTCKARTPEMVKARQATIEKVHADKD